MEQKNSNPRFNQEKSKTNYRKILELSLLMSIISLTLIFYFADSYSTKYSKYIDSSTIEIIDMPVTIPNIQHSKVPNPNRPAIPCEGELINDCEKLRIPK